MAKIKKGVYRERDIKPAEKLRLKGELRAKMARLLKKSDDAHREAQIDLLKLRSMS